MGIAILIIGIIGFIGCLIIMYTTNHGIPGIQKYYSDFRLLDMRFRYNNNILYDTFERLGKSGIDAYNRYLYLDFCFIASFLIVIIAISLKVATNTMFRNILIFFAVTRAVLDILENSLLIFLLNKFPNYHIQLADICSWVTTSKFIALYLWIFGIAAAFIIRYCIR